MESDTKQTLGDRLKEIERAEAGRKAVKGKPIMARLDGRAFHTWTRGLARPYDEKLSALMAETLRYLVDSFHPLVGYTQSDEFSLCWYVEEDSASEYLFDGKYQKLTSVLAAGATAFFNRRLGKWLPQKLGENYPMFDCRVWQVENLQEAYLNFLWRQDDATKNSISMAASHYFPHKTLQGVNSAGRIEMLKEKGINWNQYPNFFRHGIFMRRISSLVEMDWNTVPEVWRMTETQMILRSTIVDMELPPLREVEDPVKVLFG